MPAQVDSFIWSNSKRNVNNFVREINGFKDIKIYYTETDSLYNEKKMECVGQGSCLSKHDHKIGGIFHW